MVEGARIDHAHHDGFVNRALEETVGFEEALEAVVKSLEESNQLEEVTYDVTFVTLTSFHLYHDLVCHVGRGLKENFYFHSDV